MKNLKFVVVIALIAFISSCCACRRNSKNTTPLTDVEWRLTQLGGENITAEDNFRIMLSSDGRISGIGDCNRFSGSYSQSVGSSRVNGQLLIGENMISTRMMCHNQAREDAFLRMLRSADGYNIDGQRLLITRGGDVTAIFEFVPTPVVN